MYFRKDHEMTDYTMHPIGFIHSPFKDKNEMPIQASLSETTGQVEIFEEFAEGLQDIDGFSHIILLYVFHRSSGYELSVTPFLDVQKRGLFATRYPARPNPLGLSVVRLLARRANLLDIQGIDVLDGTPLLDVKPYVPDFDIRVVEKTGWYATRSR
jgi:tRNA (adenine37-N6)-methyltransferase